MIEAFFRGERKRSFPLKDFEGYQWVQMGLARWIGPRKVELVRARGAVNPRIGPHISVRMPYREVIKAAEGYLPSQRRVTRCAWTFIKGFLPAWKQRRIDALLDGV